MPTGSKQVRNQEMESLLEPHFVKREEFYGDGARMLSAVLASHRAYDGNQGAGGALIWGWMGDSVQCWGRGSTSQWTEGNVSNADYFATDYGGPYVDFDGSTEQIGIADAAWQETGTEEYFVWMWCNPASVAATMTICAKYDINANNCSWRLILDPTTPSFRFVVNATGNAVNDVVVTSTLTAVVDTWYFVAGYFLPSTLLRAFVGAATDATLTIDSNVAAIPASLFNGSAPLAIGTSHNAPPTMLNGWNGNIGIGHGRANVPAGTATAYPEINGHATRLFHQTRFFYR